MMGKLTILAFMFIAVVFVSASFDIFGNVEPSAKAESNDVYAEVNFVVDNINDINEKGETFLTSATSAGSYAVVKNYIKAGADVNITNSKGNTALMAAAANGRYLTSVELIRAKTNVAVRNFVGMTALLYAISGNHVDIAIAILNTGEASVNDSLPNGRLNGVMMAAQNNYWETLDELLRRKAKLDVQTGSGETAIMFAAVGGSVNATKLLIAAGANLNLRNNIGLTALMLASSRGHIEVVRLLLDAKADWSLKDDADLTCIDYAFESDRRDIIQLLQRTGARKSRRRH